MEPINVHSKYLAQGELEELYKKKLIPPEKKPYLTDYAAGRGPYLATVDGRAILDASSQIASLGTGFNTGLWGTSQHLESWLNLKCEPGDLEVRESLRQLLQRKLGWKDTHMFCCHSGAEANEIALGDAYRHRRSATQNRVLSFEGSFHGRMMVSLSATWNPAKREPFELPGFTGHFAPYPEMTLDNAGIKIDRPEKIKPTRDWLQLWEEPLSKNYKTRLSAHDKKAKGDALLRSEIISLKKVHSHLVKGEVFAVLIEPMQCEGGDRYSSVRFHSGLLSLCRAFRVPLIYDEVQTGFALGGPFFWHRLFEMKDSGGNPIYPNYVVTAKKSQTGLVLSHNAVDFTQQYSTASLIRGYYMALSMDSAYPAILKLEDTVRPLLKKLVTRHKKLISSPRVRGLSFAFDFATPEACADFVARRFNEGLLFYPAGSRTARFRLNLSWSDDVCRDLFERLHRLLENKGAGESDGAPFVIAPPDPSSKLLDKILEHKLRYMGKKAKAQKPGELLGELSSTLKEILRAHGDSVTPIRGASKTPLKLKRATSADYLKVKSGIASLQRGVYEPARQTSLESFEKIIRSRDGICLLLTRGKKVLGMACAGPLEWFPTERGTLADPLHGENRDAEGTGGKGSVPRPYYMLDVTVDSSLRGLGLGKLLKYGLAALAQNQGVTHLQGRNREGLAAAMWRVNQGLGATVTKYLEGDYPDNRGSRNALYYSCPMGWKKPGLNLYGGADSPLGPGGLSKKFTQKYGPVLLNKLCLSNFVSREFILNLSHVSEYLPVPLRHMYTASSPSECVDKITKILWTAKKPRHKMLTFEGGYFGEGSFMARSLTSGPLEERTDVYYPVTHLEFPGALNWEWVLEDVLRRLEGGEYLAVWAEPLGRQTMEPMPIEFLRELRAICTEKDVPLIYNDTTGAFYRYTSGSFIPSARADIRPDIGFCHLGGQMALIYMEEKYWIDTPLMLISTWDGDEYSLAAFAEALGLMEAEEVSVREGKASPKSKKKSGQRNYSAGFRHSMQELSGRFDKKLTGELRELGIDNIHIRGGAGYFTGDLPVGLENLFRKTPGGRRYLVCPSPSEMKRYLQEGWQ